MMLSSRGSLLDALSGCAPQNYSGGGQGPRIVKGFASGEVQARTAGNRAVAVLLLGSAVRICLIVNPVLLRVGHSAATGNRAHRSGLVERAGKRTVAEGLGSVAAPSRIPLINDHLYRHPASPDTAGALLLEGSRGESSMTALAAERKRRWNTAPRRWRCLVLIVMWPDFPLAGLVEFNRLQPRIRNRLRITRYRVPGAKVVFRVRALPSPDEKFLGFASDPATYLQRVTQVGMAALIERAGQSDPWLHRKQHALPGNLVTSIVPRERHAASLCKLYS